MMITTASKTMDIRNLGKVGRRWRSKDMQEQRKYGIGGVSGYDYETRQTDGDARHGLSGWLQFNKCFYRKKENRMQTYSVGKVARRRQFNLVLTTSIDRSIISARIV